MNTGSQKITNYFKINFVNLKKFKNKIETDADFRSLCSQGFALEFYKFNQ